MSPIIEIKDNLSDKALSSFFYKWNWNMQPAGKIVTLDFKKVNFISPWAIVLYSQYLLWLKEVRRQNVDIKIDKESIAGHYLCEAGVPELIGVENPCTVIRSEDRTTKLTRISKSHEIPTFANNFMKLLQIEDAEMEGALKYSLVELLRNVVQHSNSQIGGLAMAQYFPRTGLVQLAVADMGLGIRATLQEKYPEINDDWKALKFAVQPHVSGTFAPGAYSAMNENAGLGLFFIMQIATLSSGGFFLGSGRQLSDIWGDQEGTQHKQYISSHGNGWPGTFAVLQLRKDTIADFDSVLRRCRELAEQARKDPSEFALDFLDEIPLIEGLEIVRIHEFEENVEEATRMRENKIVPALKSGKIVVLDFSNIKFATQSFIHALMYKLMRDSQQVSSGLSIANCSRSTREAILAVAGYAKVQQKNEKEDGWKF